MPAAKPLSSMHILAHVLAACLLAALLVVATPAAHAQTGSSEGEYTQEQLQSFARASLEVERLNQAYMPRLQGAKTQEESEALRTAAVSEMAEAIEAEGIEVATYGEIIEEAKSNPQVAEQITEYRRELQQ